MKSTKNKTQNQKSTETFFNKSRIENYVYKFSFPRLAGTDGEKKAVELTANEFKKIGFKENQIKTRHFEFSDFYTTTLIKLIMMLNLIFNLTLMLFAYVHILLSIAVIAFMVIIVALIFNGLRHPETPGFWGEYFGDTYEATNVYIKLPAKKLPEEDAGDLVISAHLDSKSQTFNTFWRILLYRIWLYAGITLGVFYIMYLIIVFSNLEFDFRITLYGAWITIIIISSSNLSLLFLDTHNKSPGALDNASGMSIIFELSNHFLKNPLSNFNLWMCQFSAEELGTMGSRIFVNDHEKEFTKGKIFQINFDMVSCNNEKRNRIDYFKSYGVLIRKKCAPLLSNYIELAAENENLDIRGFHLSTGAHTDTVPFHLRKLDAIDITTKAAAKYTHTKHDTPAKIDSKVLLDACRVIQSAIK
ncbi:MAG: M28 family metallopeptidase, partial [Candidatus Heimdallarchaeota archaeon]